MYCDHRSETVSMTNYSSDDSYNPYLTYLQTKTKVLDRNVMSRKTAMETWRKYKQILSKVHQIIINHMGSRTCTLYQIYNLLILHISTSAQSLEDARSTLTILPKLLTTIASIYYCLPESNCLTEAIQFTCLSAVWNLMQASVSDLAGKSSYKYAKYFNFKMDEIVSAVSRLEDVKRAMAEIDAANEKLTMSKLAPERQIDRKTDYSRNRKFPNKIGLQKQSQQKMKKRLDDMQIMDMVRQSRDSSGGSAQFLLKGINLRSRDCPYTLLLNLVDLDQRLLGQITNKTIDTFKGIISVMGNDMLAAVIIVELYFDKETCFTKLPIITRVCDVLRDNQDGKMILDQSWLPNPSGGIIKQIQLETQAKIAKSIRLSEGSNDSDNIKKTVTKETTLVSRPGITRESSGDFDEDWNLINQPKSNRKNSSNSYGRNSLEHKIPGDIRGRLAELATGNLDHHVEFIEEPTPKNLKNMDKFSPDLQNNKTQFDT